MERVCFLSQEQQVMFAYTTRFWLGNVKVSYIFECNIYTHTANYTFIIICMGVILIELKLNIPITVIYHLTQGVLKFFASLD